MASDTFGSDNLGSLAQSARSKQLKNARNILLFVGILTVVVNLAIVVMAESIVNGEIDKEVKNLQRQNMVVDHQAVQEFRGSAVRTLRLANGIAVVLGIVFIVFGFMVNQHPVPITITSLILYLGAWAVYGFLDPSTLAKGVIMKIIIVVALVNAVKAALAYEREKASSPTSPDFGGDATNQPNPEF